MKTISRINPYLLTIAGALMISLAGCSDEFFNRQAGDRITPDQHFQDIYDGQASWEGAIISLQEAMPRCIMLDGLRSDMMDVTPNADQYLREINEHSYSDFNPYLSPADFYKVIINLNEVLAHLDELAANERELDDYTTYYARGELLAMRAWTYFTIARLYGGVTYIEDNLTELPENLQQNVLTKDVIIDTLINQILPYIYDPTVGIERVEIKIDHYVNSKGLLGEMYLEVGDYANAVIYLKMACESYGNLGPLYKVDNSYKDAGWATMFMNAESQELEHFSVIPFSSVEDQYNPLARWLGYGYDYVVKPTQILVDSFMAQIPAAGAPGDLYRGLGVTFGVDTVSKTSESNFVTENYITKYEIDQADPFSSDIILQRAGDLHLLLAEAYNRMGDDKSQEYALMLLNQGVNKESPKPPEFAKWSRNIGIRGRVYLAPWEVSDEVVGEERTRLIEDLIIQERAYELAFEGKRWFDLVRVAKRRGEPEFLADKVAAKFEGTPQFDAIHAKLMNDQNWYLPIK